MFNCIQKYIYCNSVPWSSVHSCYTNMFWFSIRSSTTQVLSVDANLVMFAFCISFLFSPLIYKQMGFGLLQQVYETLIQFRCVLLSSIFLRYRMPTANLSVLHNFSLPHKCN